MSSKKILEFLLKFQHAIKKKLTHSSYPRHILKLPSQDLLNSRQHQLNAEANNKYNPENSRKRTFNLIT